MKSPKDTTPPTRPRLPTAAEMDEMSGRAFLEAIRELNEENRNEVREILRARSRHPPTPAEMDDIFAEGMREALEEVRAKAPPPPTPEQAAKDPACLWAWIDNGCRYYCLEGLKEGCRRIEKHHHKKLVRLLKDRAWHLAARQVPPGHA